MINGVERKYSRVTIARKGRVITGQAVPKAETLEVNPDSARDDLSGELGEVQSFSRFGSRPLSDRLRAPFGKW